MGLCEPLVEVAQHVYPAVAVLFVLGAEEQGLGGLLVLQLGHHHLQDAGDVLFAGVDHV